MFGFKKDASSISNDIQTIVSKETKIKGSIISEGNIRIDGSIEGEIMAEGNVIIGDQGNVSGDIKGDNVMISGCVRGNVTANKKLEILSTGSLYGDVSVAILSVGEGAVFKGNSNMVKKDLAFAE